MSCGVQESMEENILVSIITVTLNRGHTLSRAVESVLNQTYSNMEYIIMDGMSQDHTLEIAHSYDQAFKEKNIRYRIISQPDSGMYDALNQGIALSHGVIIGSVNSDDYYEPDAVEAVVREYKKKPFDMVYGNLRIIKPSGTIIKKAKLKKMVSTRYWNHPATFIAKEVYRKEPYKCESIYDDCDLMLRLRKKQYEVRVIDKVLSNFVFGGMSTRRDWGKTKERIRIRWRIYQNNGYGVIYYLDSVLIEVAKFLTG